MIQKKKVAVVAGATGVVGRGVAERIAADPAWDVVALARKPVDIPGVRFVATDLTDAEQCRKKLSDLVDTTHIFYTARFDHVAGTPEPIAINMAMLRNVVDAIEPVAADLSHIHLVHGTKWYGSNLGPFSTPAREDDPRGLAANFYYAQQDFIADRQKGRSWTWSTSRPHGICHAVPDAPRNLVLVIAIYALISKELGLPLCFPGTAANYNAIYQCTSADQLCEAMLWLAETQSCANQAFNVLNGDYIRWSRLWPAFAAYFGMEVGSVKTIRLADVMADKAPVWDAIVARNGLKATPYDKLVLWGYGDFVFTPHWDIMSDVTKLRNGGFNRTVSTEAEFIKYFDEFKAMRVIP